MEQRLSLLDVIRYECKKLQEMKDRVYSGMIHIDDQTGKSRQTVLTTTKSNKSVRSNVSSRPYSSKSWLKSGDGKKKKKQDGSRNRSGRQVKDKHSDEMLSIDDEYKKQLKNSRRGGRAHQSSKSPASLSKSSVSHYQKSVYDDQKRRPCSSRHINCMYPDEPCPQFKATPVPASVRSYVCKDRKARSRSKQSSRTSVVKCQSTRQVDSDVTKVINKKAYLSDTEAVKNSLRSETESTETQSDSTEDQTQLFDGTQSHRVSETGPNQRTESSRRSRSPSVSRREKTKDKCSGTLNALISSPACREAGLDEPSTSTANLVAEDLTEDNGEPEKDEVPDIVKKSGVANKSTTTKVEVMKRLGPKPVPLAASDPDHQGLMKPRKPSVTKSLVSSNSISEPSSRQYHRMTGKRLPCLPKPYIPPCSPRSPANKDSKTICECCSNIILNVENGRLCEHCNNKSFQLDTQKSLGKQLRNCSETKFLKYEQSKRNGTLSKELSVLRGARTNSAIVTPEELLDPDDLEEVEVEVRLYLQDFDGTGTML